MNRRSFFGLVGKAIATLWMSRGIPESNIDAEFVECRVDVEVGPFDPRWSVSIRVNGGGWMFVGEGKGSILVRNDNSFSFGAGHIHSVRNI